MLFCFQIAKRPRFARIALRLNPPRFNNSNSKRTEALSLRYSLKRYGEATEEKERRERKRKQSESRKRTETEKRNRDKWI